MHGTPSSGDRWGMEAVTPYRVLVCGSRSWTDGLPIRRLLRIVASGNRHGRVVVMTGGARGADRLAETIARGLGLAVETHPADWQREGRRAGILRNLRMLDAAPDLVLAFQRNGSRGTQHVIEEAQRRGLPVHVVRP